MDNKELMNKWTQCFGIGLVITIIDFIIMVNQKDASTGAKITAIILLVGIVFCIISVVKINMCNAKVKICRLMNIYQIDLLMLFQKQKKYLE